MILMVQLSESVAARLSHLNTRLIREHFIPVLEKLYKKEKLSHEELAYEAAPTEVAAIWSITNQTDVSSDHPRQLKRIGSIQASSNLGTVSFYRVGDIIDRKVSHTRGRKPAAREEEDGGEELGNLS